MRCTAAAPPGRFWDCALTKQGQSGDSDPQLRITKTGNLYLRKLLVQAAHYVLGRFGRTQPCDVGG